MASPPKEATPRVPTCGVNEMIDAIRFLTTFEHEDGNYHSVEDELAVGYLFKMRDFGLLDVSGYDAYFTFELTEEGDAVSTFVGTHVTHGDQAINHPFDFVAAKTILLEEGKNMSDVNLHMVRPLQILGLLGPNSHLTEIGRSLSHEFQRSAAI
jgi:hypothetical protein